MGCCCDVPGQSDYYQGYGSNYMMRNNAGVGGGSGFGSMALNSFNGGIYDQNNNSRGQTVDYGQNQGETVTYGQNNNSRGQTVDYGQNQGETVTYGQNVSYGQAVDYQGGETVTYD